MTTGRINQIAFISSKKAIRRSGQRRQRPRVSGSEAPCDNISTQLMTGRANNRTIFRMPTHCSLRERGLYETSRVTVLGKCFRTHIPLDQGNSLRTRSTHLNGPLPGSQPVRLDHTRPWEPFFAFLLFCESTLMLHIYKLV